MIRQNGKNVRRAVIVGAGDLGVNLLKQVETMPWAGIHVIGFFDDKIDEEVVTEVQGKPILGNTAAINEYLELHDMIREREVGHYRIAHFGEMVLKRGL